MRVDHSKSRVGKFTVTLQAHYFGLRFAKDSRFLLAQKRCLLPTNFMLWQEKSVQCENEYKTFQNFDLQFLTRQNQIQRLLLHQMNATFNICGQTEQEIFLFQRKYFIM
jgi:hypothetical protein